MKNIILILSVIFLFLNVNAQYSNSDWYFGVTNHLQFQGGQINLNNTDTFPLGYIYTSFSISDTNHKLIISTNGSKVINGSLEPIQGLPGIPCTLGVSGPPGINDSVTDGSRGLNTTLILPLPGSQSIYYIFSLKDTQKIGTNHMYQVLYYNVVDMSLNGGNGGAVLPLNRKLYVYPLYGGIGYELTAIRHANGRDWWILGASYQYDSLGGNVINNSVDTWLFSPSGLSNIEKNILPIKDIGGGQIAVSNDGTQIIYGMVEYLCHVSFDRCTGIVSNFSILDSIDDYIYEYGKTWIGASYSMNDSVVYASTYANMYQYVLSPTGAPEHRTWIFNNGLFTDVDDSNSITIGLLDLGPDSNVYFTYGYNYWWNKTTSGVYSHSLSTVYNAGAPAPLCTFENHNIITDFPTSLNLPLNINWSLGALKGSGCDTLGVYTAVSTSNKDKPYFNLYPNPTDGYFTITYSLYDNAMFTLYDITGRKVLEMLITKGTQVSNINVSDMANGLYLYSITSNSANFSGKILVSK